MHQQTPPSTPAESLAISSPPLNEQARDISRLVTRLHEEVSASVAARPRGPAAVDAQAISDAISCLRNLLARMRDRASLPLHLELDLLRVAADHLARAAEQLSHDQAHPVA